MGKPQSTFLGLLKPRLREEIDSELVFIEGQSLNNSMDIQFDPELRRNGLKRPRESFEFGDCRFEYRNMVTVVVEFESAAISIHNLLKYWPFIRGEMSVPPKTPLIMCHFSNWHSYGSHRDLWGWLAKRISADPERVVDFQAKQFDHGGTNSEIRQKGLSDCVHWIQHQLSCFTPPPT